MATKLEKTLKREVTIGGKPFVVSLAPEGLKVVGKGRRKGLELSWADLVSGDAALATALNASVAQGLVLEPSRSNDRARKRLAKRRKSDASRNA
ncbi:MAG: hypothetical protein ABR570_17840 [Burkholderiales bacterium]